jgi:hypothetical protein
MAKSWDEKYNNGKKPAVKVLDKPWAGYDKGAKMLISTPQEIDEYIKQIPYGVNVRPEKIREDLAKKHMADFTCPLTTGIFLKIIAEKYFKELAEDQDNITPFWRVIDPSSNLAYRLSFGSEFIAQMRAKET